MVYSGTGLRGPRGGEITFQLHSEMYVGYKLPTAAPFPNCSFLSLEGESSASVLPNGLYPYTAPGNPGSRWGGELIIDLISHSGAPRLKFQTSTSLDITPGDMELAAMSSNREAGLAAES